MRPHRRRAYAVPMGNGYAPRPRETAAAAAAAAAPALWGGNALGRRGRSSCHRSLSRVDRASLARAPPRPLPSPPPGPPPRHDSRICTRQACNRRKSVPINSSFTGACAKEIASQTTVPCDRAPCLYPPVEGWNTYDQTSAAFIPVLRCWPTDDATHTTAPTACRRGTLHDHVRVNGYLGKHRRFIMLQCE